MPNDDGNAGGNGGSGTAGRGTRDDRDDRDDSRGGRGRDRDRDRGPSDEGRGVAQKLLRRFRGKAEDALAELADENKELRLDRRDYRERLAKFEKPGVVVLEGDDAKHYAEYKALGLPADVKKKLDTLPDLEKRVSENDRTKGAVEGAKLLGWNADATSAAVLDKGLVVSLVDGKDKDGKDIKVPHVKALGADEKTATVPMAEWFTKNAGYIMPALTAKAAAGDGKGGAGSNAGGSNASNPSSGTGTQTQYVDQSGGAGSGTAGRASGTPAAPIPGRAKFLTPGQRAAGNTAAAK